MKTTVSKVNLYFFLYTAEVLIPSFFTGSITSVLNHVFMLCGIMFLLSRRYRLNKYMSAVVGYFALLVGITFYRHTDMATLSFVLENVRLLVYLSTVDCMFSRDSKATQKILGTIIGFYVLLDFLSIVFFPEGLTTVAKVWNEWTTSYEASWIYGRKNNRIYWYTAVSLMSIWTYSENKSAKNYMRVWLYMLIMIVASILESSSTSIMVALVVDIAILVYLQNRRVVGEINVKGILIGYGVLTVLLVLGSVAFLRPIVEGIFHKDLTFSGRTDIWAQMCLLIVAKPILGYGVSSGTALSTMLGKIDRTSAHNQWLNFLYQGGLVLFAAGAYIYLLDWKAVDRLHNQKLKFLLVFFLVAVSINMLFETQFSTIKAQLLLLLIYWFARINTDKERYEKDIKY